MDEIHCNNVARSNYTSVILGDLTQQHRTLSEKPQFPFPEQDTQTVQYLLLLLQ